MHFNKNGELNLSYCEKMPTSFHDVFKMDFKSQDISMDDSFLSLLNGSLANADFKDIVTQSIYVGSFLVSSKVMYE